MLHINMWGATSNSIYNSIHNSISNSSSNSNSIYNSIYDSIYDSIFISSSTFPNVTWLALFLFRQLLGSMDFLESMKLIHTGKYESKLRKTEYCLKLNEIEVKSIDHFCFCLCFVISSQSDFFFLFIFEFLQYCSWEDSFTYNSWSVPQKHNCHDFTYLYLP